MSGVRFIYFILVSSCYVFIIFADGEDQVCNNITNPVQDIKARMLCNYNKNDVPRKGYMQITMQVIPKYIEYNDLTKKISMSSWILMVWRDQRLRFNRNKLNGKTKILLKSSDIWTLDLHLYDRLGDSTAKLTPTLCAVSFLGSISCLFPSTHETLCLPNVENWPYDIQNCSFTYAAWVKKGRAVLRLTRTPIKFNKGFINHAEWKIISYSASSQVTKGVPGMDDVRFLLAKFSFWLQRHSIRCYVEIVVPIIVMMILSISVLFLDLDNFERILLMGVNIFTQILYFQMLWYQLPLKFEKIPLVVKCLRNTIMISVLIVIETTILRSFIESDKYYKAIIKFCNYCEKNNTLRKIIRCVLPESEEGRNNESTAIDYQKMLKLSHCLDKIFFVIIFIAYVYTYLMYMPAPKLKTVTYYVLNQ